MSISVIGVPSRAFAFSPSKITISGAAVGQQIDFTFNGFSATRYADGSGSLVFPLAKALKSAWATTDVGDVEPAFQGDYNSGSKLVKYVTLEIKSGGSHIAASPYTILAIWGALQVAEEEPTSETIYRFGNLPLTYTQNIGVYLGIDVSPATFPALGMDYFIGGEQILSVHSADGDVLRTITVEQIDYCENDIYLRWIDRLGQYRYFAFKKGETTQVMKKGNYFSRELLSLEPINGFLYKSQKQLINIESYEIQKLAVPTTTYEQQRFLQSLETSIKCWMYLGNQSWIEVEADVKPIVLDERYYSNKAVEVDIKFPKMYLQTL